MEILRIQNSPLYMLTNIPEDWLIGQLNVATNYKSYLDSITKLSDKQLLIVAPGSSAKTVREHLALQYKACEDFIDTYNKILHVTDPNAKPN